jgi:hypothetical protein
MSCNSESADSTAKTKSDAACDASTTSCAQPPPLGTISLVKLKFETTYDVCSDAVENFSDFKHFHILVDEGGVPGYHWLSARTHADNAGKAPTIPITFNGSETVKCTAYFEVEKGKSVPAAPVFKIKDTTGGKYTFDKQTGATSGSFSLTFTATNQPYANTIDYISSFNLSFTYSIDGEASWLDAGTSSNELYITWKAFNLSSLYEDDVETATMRLQSTKTGSKKYILESLLHIGCLNAIGKGKSEEEILDAIFTIFETCNVKRKNETFTTDGMGYWRGLSDGTKPMAFRGVRFLLKFGEARCGEFTGFFSHLAFTQGITNMNEVPVATNSMKGAYTAYTGLHKASLGKLDAALSGGGYSPTLLLVKNCSMQPQLDAFKKPTLVLENFNRSQAQGNSDAVNIFWDHVFSRHDGTMRYYDASYGKAKSVFPDKATSNLDNYCNKMLDGVLFLAGGGKNDVYIRHFANKVYTGVSAKTVINNAYAYLYVRRSDEI